jgi:repressor LexA
MTKALGVPLMKKLTNRQAKVLEFIIDSLDSRGYPPTIREIGTHMEIRSTNGVNDHLKALERKGYLVRDQSKSRALRPLCNPSGGTLDNSSSANTMQIPVVGRIAAGSPIDAIEHAEDTITIEQGLLGRSTELFALNVKGDSMIDDGILDGDLIFVNRQNEAPGGAIVAVMIEGEATVKRIYYENDRIRLQPANEAMEPIYVRREEFKETSILGLVKGVFR